MAWFKMDDKKQEAALRVVVVKMLNAVNSGNEPDRIIEELRAHLATLTYQEAKLFKHQLEKALL